jgi:radical SAM superfamily enzyme YgiQ (UPF0313 family)
MQPPVAPIALDYLASALADRGLDVDLLDLCSGDDYAAEIERYFHRKDADVVAFSIRNTDDTSLATRDFFIPLFKRMLDCLKMHSEATIVLGGSGFSIMPEAVLDHCGIDLGIWGEGEYALPLLAERITAGEDYSDVPGLIYRSGDGFQHNPPTYIDLEAAPTPQRTFVDNRRYFAEGGMGGIETKRGCPKRCVYCADPLGKGDQIRLRTTASVADEIEAMLYMGIDHLHLCDSEFNFPAEHAEAVCHEIVRRGLGSKLRWYAYCSTAPFTNELAELFKRAGCAGINFGVDSADDRMLRSLGRDFDPGDVERTAQICRDKDIVFMYDLLLGAPGETRESLRHTIETMKRLEPHRVGANLGVRLWPGTALAEAVRGQGRLDRNPGIHGTPDDDLFFPVFFISPELGDDPAGYLSDVIGGDRRFLFMSGDAAGQNYNYNDNTLLANAIREGYRGAFWDILRRIDEGNG